MDAWWQRWFAWRDEAGPLAPVVYDPWLVALSLVIACAGGVAAMQLVSLARRADRFGPAVAHGAYALASLALGVSVWAMHFIGMLAADLCQPVRYDPWITALSMLPSVAASAIGHRPSACGCTRGPARRDGPACARWCRCCRRSSASASTESRCINRAT